MHFDAERHVLEHPNLKGAIAWPDIVRDKLDEEINTEQISLVIHSLDDFLFIGPSEAKCHVDFDNFLRVCCRIGVLIANEKPMGPTNALQFAGITLDTKLMEARLQENKLAKCRTQLIWTRQRQHSFAQ